MIALYSKSTIKQMLVSATLLGSMLSPFSVAYAEEEKQCTTLTASGNPEYPPFLWQKDGDRKLHGAVANVMADLSQKIDIPIETIYVGPWSRAQQEVRSGRVDLIAGAFYTSERADYMEYFTPAMMFTKSVVWQSTQAPFEFGQWNDLEGRWGATVINNSFGQEFDDFAKHKLNILTVASVEQAFSMLAAGRTDYVLYERSPGQAYIDKLSLNEKVKSVEPSISSEGLYLTISKASPCNTQELKQKISVALRELVDDGEQQTALLSALTEWSVVTERR